MKKTNSIRSLCRSLLASVGMQTNPPAQTRRFGRHVSSSAQVLLLLLALAALALPYRAAAGVFAVTSLSPSAQTVNVGTPITVNVVYAIGSATYGQTYGIDLRIDFDPTVLQVASVTAGSGSPFTTPVPDKNVVDNTTGLLRYGATGPNVANVTYTVATIVFTPIAAGTSALHLHEVRQYFSGYGPFGIDGTASSGSVTVNAPPPLFFTDSLATDSASPNISIPADKYQKIASGLQRSQNSTGGGDASSNDDRPMVTTLSGGYLQASQFTATITINLTSPDIAYFGFGQTNPDPNYFNEPTPSFLFRIHNNWVGYSGIQAWPSTFGSSPNNPDHFFGFPPGASLPDYGGGPVTFVIKKDGDNLTMSIPSMGASKTFSISQYATQMGLNSSNTRIFFGNSNVGTLFSNLSIVPGDTTPPVITAPADMVVEATGPSGAVVTFAATANDNVNGPVSVTANPASGSTFPLGVTTVQLSASDAAGNTATASFTITVRDTTPPVISAPATVTAEATSAAGAAVTFVATASDAVSGNVLVTANPPSGSTHAIGFSSVSLSAKDAAGNTASQSILVNVRDTTPPALAVPASQIIEATSAAGAVATFSATATDAVGVTSLTYSAASGSTFPIGTTVVTVTAKDAANNTSSGSFSITVRDTTPPALTVPGSQIIEATSAAGAVAIFSATATDAVGVTSLTYSAASGSTFPIGTTTVSVTAADAAGNSSSGSFTVTVRDTTPPVISSLTASSTVLWPPNHQMVAIKLTPVASDAVGVASLKIISATSNEPDNGLGDGDTAGDIEITGALTLNLRAERSGAGSGRVYTITVQAKDAAGNASTKTVTVSVPKSQSGK